MLIVAHLERFEAVERRSGGGDGGGREEKVLIGCCGGREEMGLLGQFWRSNTFKEKAFYHCLN